MTRRIPSDRTDPPNPDVAQEWTPLFAPFVAPNGLVVEAVPSVEAMIALGDHFVNALELRRFSEMQARRAADGSRHVYRVMAGSVPQSCGELIVRDGVLKVFDDRTHNNGRGGPETGAAVGALADAVNAGSVPLAHALLQDGFEPFAGSAVAVGAAAPVSAETGLESLLERVRREEDGATPGLARDIHRVVFGSVGMLVPDILRDLHQARAFARRATPNFWMTSGLCELSGHATIGPDFNGAHREALEAEWGNNKVTDGGFSEDLLPGVDPASECLAVVSCVLQALIYKAGRGPAV